MNEPAASGGSEPARKKILIVDDEPDILMYLTTFLMDNGYQPLQARSADEAFAVLEKQKPDMICLDIMMPKQSGSALYQKIRLDDRVFTL